MRSPFEQDVLFALGPFAITHTILVTWLIVLLLVTGSWFATRRLGAQAPGRVQLVLELLVEGIDAQIRATLERDPAPYRTLVGSIFVFVLVANTASLLPGIEPPTSRLETDAALALIVLGATVVYGIRAQGLGGYLRSFASPTWIMIPVNVFGQLTRTVSMAVRLFGNVMSGAFLVAVVLSLAGLLVPVPLMALDLLTGLVQAYIFAVLATVFIGAAIDEPDESDEPDGPVAKATGGRRWWKRRPG